MLLGFDEVVRIDTRIHTRTRRPTSALYSTELYRTIEDARRTSSFHSVRTINGNTTAATTPKRNTYRYTNPDTPIFIQRSHGLGEGPPSPHVSSWLRGLQPPDCICCVAAARPASHRSRASRPIVSREAAGVGSPLTPLADAQPHVRGHVPHASKLRARSHGLRLPCGGADLCDTSAGRRHGRHRLK